MGMQPDEGELWRFDNRQPATGSIGTLADANRHALVPKPKPSQPRGLHEPTDFVWMCAEHLAVSAQATLPAKQRPDPHRRPRRRYDPAVDLLGDHHRVEIGV
jgi:hypothetical protein